MNVPATGGDDPAVPAPGAPGIAPTWTSSAKDMVGSSLGPARLWFTIGFGIVNEVYFPRIDTPQIRDLGFIVADDAGFWCEVKRLERYRIETPAPGIPALRIIHSHERFTLTLRIVGDPRRDALLVEVSLEGDAALRPYALLAPHIGGTGHGNLAEVARHGGRRVLRAGRTDDATAWLALAAVDGGQRDAFGCTSAGYVGTSDGWQDFDRHGAMRWQYGSAGPGNVALTGELPQRCVLALAFGASPEAATTLAIGALAQPFAAPWQQQMDDWTRWHAALTPPPPDLSPELRAQFAVSAMALHVHQDKIHPGAMVASLSVPWGNSRDERGGYHLVWPRDLVECAGALLALDQEAEARDVLRYLIASQHADGHWNQNQWLGGKPYWAGVQLDEVAFPVLLAALLAERDALGGIEVRDMVRRALGFIARTGPATDQDRWEEDAGINAFTLAVCIAALVAGAGFLDPAAREFALALADDWNARIEDLTTVTGTALARRLGVGGYYVRVAPPAIFSDDEALHRGVAIKNQLQEAAPPADEQISTDALQLVRFGLRRAEDPLVRDTVAVIDALLRVDLPTGTAWRRYNGDGYGEHEDGTPFDGTGCGRPWPLLAGERGHYELVAGRDPLPFLRSMAAMASDGGMLPEQVWDAAPLPSRRLYPGRPTGSAMPLAWAHAEFVKLALSRQGMRPCDCPASVRDRYRGQRPVPRLTVWLDQAPMSRIRAGTDTLLCLHEPALVHWGVDGWHDSADLRTRPLPGLDLHLVQLPTAALQAGQAVDFTWRWQASGAWLGLDHRLRVVA